MGVSSYPDQPRGFARFQPWLQAARPLAHPMIFVPLVLGQAFAFRVHGQFQWTLFIYAHLFGVLYQVYLLYLNDYADDAIDRTNERYWLSGGSRVLPEGKLRGSDLRAGARVMLAVMVALTVYLGVLADRPLMPVWLLLAVILCWVYNSPPLQLSYRGHGEIPQGLGCGVLLPVIGFYLQHGAIEGFPWAALIPLYLIFHAGNIITALPDYPSDRQGGKRTFPVRHGEPTARLTALLVLALAYITIVPTSPPLAPRSLAIIVIPAALLLALVVISGTLRKADAAAWSACKRFVNWTSASQAWLLGAWLAALLLGGRA